MYFEIQKNSDIWIYGTGIRGEQLFRTLDKQGCSICGFIDLRAKSIREKCGKKVISLEEALENLQSEIVIIALQNGLKHGDIARKFALHNINKLLFLPMKENMTKEKKSLYRKKYFEVLNNVVLPITEIPLYEEKLVNCERDIINRIGEMVFFWCDIKFIYTSLYLKERTQSTWNMSEELMEQYCDIEIKRMKPYIELFEFLEGKEISLAEYFDLQGRCTEVEKTDLINDRRELYKVYQDALIYDQSFFTDAPSVVKWNKKGYFNVNDGMHRIMYLISKGYTKVPVAASEEDYQCFMLFNSTC